MRRSANFYVNAVCNAVMLCILFVPPCAVFAALGHAIAGPQGVVGAAVVLGLCLAVGAWLEHKRLTEEDT